MPSLPEYFTVSESIFTVYRKNSKITLQDNGHRMPLIRADYFPQ